MFMSHLQYFVLALVRSIAMPISSDVQLNGAHQAVRHLWSRLIVAMGLLLILSGTASLLSACQTPPEFDSVYTRITEQTLTVGMPIPVPTDTPLLTISGAIGHTNAGNTIIMDRATIEQVGLVEYQVTDPFEHRPITYRGVLMRDLLTLWQVDAHAKTMKLTAINDYQVEIPLEDFSMYPVLFAMQADGAYMEVSYRGPAMIVYPIETYEFDTRTNQRKWIWQIKSIELY